MRESEMLLTEMIIFPISKWGSFSRLTSIVV